MITFLLITALIITLGLNIASFILIRNLLKKQAVYEKWILDFKSDVIDTHAMMKLIDKQGTFATSLNDKGQFEADDQVGQVFKRLVALIEKLNERSQ